MRSMTGFASAEGALEAEGVAFRWDAKSVNGRGLDLKIRAPAGWDAEEPGWRALASKRFARGSVSLSLTLSETAPEGALSLNHEALARAAGWAAEAAKALEAAGVAAQGASPEALLQIRGVLESAQTERRSERSEALSRAVAAALEKALDGLAAARAEEGARLAETLGRIVTEIESLTKAAAERAEARSGTAKERLAERVAALIEAGAPSDEGRLAQELAMLATRLDVQEEIDRLRAHIEAARGLIAAGEPVGRKMDFLAQEFLREANTLCSKSQDAPLTETGLALKVAIDQLKEQAANVE